MCYAVKTRIRYFLLVVTLLGLTSLWSNIIAFNFSVLSYETVSGSFNSTTNETEPRVIFTQKQETLLTSMMGLAAFLTTFVVTYLMTFFGDRLVFTAFGLLSAFATALMPLSLAAESFGALLTLRIFQGVAFAVIYPMIGVFTSQWTAGPETGLFVSTLVANVQLSPTLTNFISGPVSESSLGWQGVLYGHAIVGVIVFLIFFLVYRNDPAKHSWLTNEERDLLAKKGHNKSAIPYKAIFKTKVIWGIIAAAFGNFVVVTTVFLYSSTFFNSVLNLAVASAGLYSALPPLIEFIVKLATGALSDRLRCFSQRSLLRFFNSCAFFLSAASFVVLAFLGTGSQMLPFIFLSVATGILGMTAGGFFKCASLVSKQYGRFVMSLMAQTFTLSMVFIPLVIHVLIPNDTMGEWHLLFWLLAGILVVTNVIFVIFCDSEPAHWTTEEFHAAKISEQNSATPISAAQDNLAYVGEFGDKIDATNWNYFRREKSDRSTWPYTGKVYPLGNDSENHLPGVIDLPCSPRQRNCID